MANRGGMSAIRAERDRSRSAPARWSRSHVARVCREVIRRAASGVWCWWRRTAASATPLCVSTSAAAGGELPSAGQGAASRCAAHSGHGSRLRAGEEQAVQVAEFLDLIAADEERYTRRCV